MQLVTSCPTLLDTYCERYGVLNSSEVNSTSTSYMTLSEFITGQAPLHAHMSVSNPHNGPPFVCPSAYSRQYHSSDCASEISTVQYSTVQCNVVQCSSFGLSFISFVCFVFAFRLRLFVRPERTMLSSAPSNERTKDRTNERTSQPTNKKLTNGETCAVPCFIWVFL